MTDFHMALLGFWGQFGVPVFIQGVVPTDQPFPYVTIEIARPAALGTAVLVAYDWHRRGDATPQPMAERAELMGRIASAIPESGARIDFDGGFAILHRNPAQFQSYAVDEEDESIIMGRTSYELTYYGM